MKKVILIFMVFFAVIITANAQRPGIVYGVTADTVQGNETVNFDLPAITGDYDTYTIQALCSETGGTSDGTIILEGSLDDSSWETITEEDGILKGYPNDTLTITDGAVGMWILQEQPFKYYRLSATGTADDSTLVTPKVLFK